MSESPSNGNGFSTKELLIRLEGRFDEHARSVQASIMEMQRALVRHDEALKDVDTNSKRISALETDKLVRDARTDERGRLIRLAFGTSVLSVIGTIFAAALAIYNLTHPPV